MDEDLKAMHLLDYQFFSEDKSKFPSNAVAVVYNYNSDVRYPWFGYLGQGLMVIVDTDKANGELHLSCR